MNAKVEVECRLATEAERNDLLGLMRDDLADRIDRIMAFLGITWAQFEQLYKSRGEVRVILREREVVGHCWIELRGRELHLHAIFVLPHLRGRGTGTATLRRLEAEFRDKADVIELGVEADNTEAKSLYLRDGFVVTKTLPNIGFEIMRKRLGNQPDGPGR